VGLPLRKIRLRLVWLLIIPFLILARPSEGLLMAGTIVSLVGLAVRAWASGFILKDRELATSGPYAFTRNPLYLGSFFVGAGVTIAGGLWGFVVAFLAFFALVYGKSMRVEAAGLTERFGKAYEDYASRVPLFVPRLLPSGGGRSLRGFTWRMYKKNREYEAGLGTLFGLLFLFAKMVWLG
jgi:protein-S-isoprenylcysteine O-methyltransferase Ste14